MKVNRIVRPFAFFLLFILSKNIHSQELITNYLDRLDPLSSFDGYSFLGANNTDYQFCYNGNPIPINLSDTIPLKVFNEFVSRFLYPKVATKMFPKMLRFRGDSKVDSIRMSDVGRIEPYLIGNKSCAAKVIALGKVNVSDVQIEFLLFTDTPEGVFVETYVFDKNKKRVISYVPVFRGEKRDKESCALLGRNLVSTYQTLQIKDGIIVQAVNDGFNELWNRKISKTNEGYYEVLWDDNPISKSQFYDAVINDVDGYTNVRRYPDGKSQIMYKIYNNEKFRIEKFSEAANWYRIFKYEDFSGGWIHKSRVKVIDAK